MKIQEKKFENWNVLIRKAIAIEAKIWRRPVSQIKNVDQYCLLRYHSNLQAYKSY